MIPISGEIVLYSTDCPRCAVLEKKLEKAGVGYTVCKDIAKMRSLGLLSAPAIDIGGRILAFSEAIAWVNKVQEEK